MHLLNLAGLKIKDTGLWTTSVWFTLRAKHSLFKFVPNELIQLKSRPEWQS